MNAASNSIGDTVVHTFEMCEKCIFCKDPATTACLGSELGLDLGFLDVIPI